MQSILRNIIAACALFDLAVAGRTVIQSFNSSIGEARLPIGVLAAVLFAVGTVSLFATVYGRFSDKWLIIGAAVGPVALGRLLRLAHCDSQSLIDLPYMSALCGNQLLCWAGGSLSFALLLFVAVRVVTSRVST